MIQDVFEINNNTSLLIIQFKESSNITIGVPHHTPGGTPNMPCPKHTDGDENAAYIGEYIAKELNCSFVCACNYFLDPNKCGNTDYSLAIAKSKPKYLIEIHGHGKSKSKNDVEISCGSKKEEINALELKREIDSIIGKIYRKKPKWNCLKKIKIEARFGKIHFQAKNTATIRDKRWKSYHIELSPKLRIVNRTKATPPIGYKFSEILSKAIRNICK